MSGEIIAIVTVGIALARLLVGLREAITGRAAT